jgi:multidrug resistance efflux pump
VLDLSPRPDAELQAALRALHWGAGRLEGILYQRRLDEIRASESRATLALELLAGLGEQTRFDEALLRLANDIASRLQCERVAIGMTGHGNRVRLQALSGASWFERKGDFVIALENAMEEALDQGCSVGAPALPGREGVIAVAHRELAKVGQCFTAVLTVGGRGIGAITCQLAAPRDAAFLASLEAIAALVAPQLGLRQDLTRWLTGTWVARGAEFLRALKDPRRPGFWGGALAIAVAVLFLAIATGPYRVAARAVVEGEVQRAIVAPFDGFVASASLRAGQRVKAGDELAALDDRDLLLDQQKWRSESEQAERKYRDALAKHDPTNARILSAQLTEATAQLDLAEQKIARARLTAPFDGVIVTGDLSQMLGSPVEKGKLLFEVAPLDAYRVVLKVPEGDIRYIRIGETGQIVLAGMADQRLPFVVKNIGIATAEEGQNLFRVEAELSGSVASLRPGMEGVAKVAVGQRHYLWIWTHSLVDWLSLKLWRWLP